MQTNSMGRITYYNVAKRKWVKRVWAEQCGVRVLISKCQGVKDHDGDHWCYAPSGSLDKTNSDGGASMIPPGHADYISPIEMDKLYFIRHHSDVDVTDPVIIEKLENGETPEWDASLDRPVNKYD